MDDLQLVRELDDTPLKSADQLASARAQLVAGMKPRGRGRAGIIAIATIAVAATGTAVAMVLPSTTPDTPATPRTEAAAPTTTPVDTAVQLLTHAAATARSKPEVVPRPDQFYYLRDGEWEAWFSVDGTHDGRVSTGKQNP